MGRSDGALVKPGHAAGGAAAWRACERSSGMAVSDPAVGSGLARMAVWRHAHVPSCLGLRSVTGINGVHMSLHARRSSGR